MKRVFYYAFTIFILSSLTTVLVIWGCEEHTFQEAVLIALMLFGAGEPLSLNVQDLSWYTGVLMLSQTMLGLSGITIAFGFLTNFLVSEKISELIKREKIKMKDHVIVCGLGNVGFKIVKELEMLQQELVVVDRGDQKDYVELIRKRGHKVILDNLKHESVLEEAGVMTAKSVIICTGNDLLNMEVAINIRHKREDILIIMRMFDQDLASKIVDVFNIKVAFSASTIAAPVFAAASFDRAVFDTVKVEKELFVTAKIEIKEPSDLIGMSIQDLQSKDLVILKLISGEERLKFPSGSRKLQNGDRFYITCSLDTLKEIKQLNNEK